MTAVVTESLAGRYQLRCWLAAGGMGQVWRGFDEVLRRPVAVKLLPDGAAGDRAAVGRFRTEARRAAAVSHPGIASIFDYGEAELDGAGEPTAYLVMELVDGEPLSALLAREGRLPLRRAVDVVAQAALAVGAAHRAGLVHRDVKAGNLLVRADGLVKVIDFGIAQRLGEDPDGPRAETVVGTAGYLSPEQVAGKPATPASDVYALGVVAYECLAGRRPFDGDDPVAVARAHRLRLPPPLPIDVPAPVRALVAQAMAKDPAARPPDGDAFGRRLLGLRAVAA
jgi:serine/threonine-protein kinase